VIHLYSVMDSAYDATTISDYISGSGKVPIIDPNKRRKEKRTLHLLNNNVSKLEAQLNEPMPI
jgi:hypothetical protein